MARRELAARDDIIRGKDLWFMGHWRFHTGIVQHSPLRNSNINTPTPQDRSKAPAPKAPQHHSQPSHPQASTSAKTQPPHPPLFPLLPLLTLPSIPPSIPLSPYPAPSHRQTLSRPPATNPKASHRGILISVPSKSGSPLIPLALETP